MDVYKKELPSISQRAPENLARHEQENDDGPSFEQVPPFKHGMLAHGVPILTQVKWFIIVIFQSDQQAIIFTHLPQGYMGREIVSSKSSNKILNR